MDKRFITTMAVSALLATLVAAGFYRLAGVTIAPGSPPRLVPVVCAKTALPVGTRVSRDDLKLVSMPASLKPSDSYARIDEVVDRPVVATILQGEPVLKPRLAQPGSGAGLAPMIPRGMRALSVRVNDVVGVAGYAEPGMRVDVLVTGHPANSPDAVTRTVLQNVLVLSAGQVLQPEPKGQAINATLVTLEVTPQQAELLTLAGGSGQIQLVLRNSTDSAIQPSSGTQLNAVYGNAARVAAAPAAIRNAPAEPRTLTPRPEPARPAEKVETVEIIRGSRISEEPLPPRIQPDRAALSAQGNNQ